jgi:tRNA A-37 threonylcarbamoyl transferase component Bud32
VDLAEEFFKHDGSFSFGEERNSSVFRGSNVYDDIEEEWEQLKRLHKKCPEHVVEPLMPVYKDEDGEKKLAGFYMERFEGELLQDYLLNSEDIRENRRIISEVEGVVERLHSEGVVHGDLANNILYNGETFKLYDPVGVPVDEEAYENMRQFDRGDIQVLRDKSDPFDELR